MLKNNYTIEPVNKDGALDASRIGAPGGLDRVSIAENKVFDLYFANHRDEERASWTDVRNWLAYHGYRIRRITWC